MNTALEMLDRVLFGNSITMWSVAIGAALVVLLAGILTRRLVRGHYERLSKTQSMEVLELPLKVVSKTTVLFLIIVAAFVAISLLETPPHVQSIAQTVVTIAAFWQLGLWAATAAVAWLDLRRKDSTVTDRAAVGTLSIIGVVVRFVIWSVVLLLTLDNLGVDITALVAGLGIGGIAVALAVQNVLGDLLASLSIALDKPFVVGDFLIVDDFLGSVEYIGIKSTRLRSLSGEQIVMSNADLLGSRVRNYGRMQERRVVFSISVAHQTPRDQIEKIPALLREIVESQQNVRFDRSHFAKISPTSLDYEVVYYVLSADYNKYMDVQQIINIRIMDAFMERRIELAYPTQKLWLSRSRSLEDVDGENGGYPDDRQPEDRRGDRQLAKQ